MEKLNIAEILRHCPKGMELDCVMYDNVSFDKVSDDEKSVYPIFCYITDEKGNRSGISFTENGYESKRYGAKCVIFPKGKTTWEGFQRPFKDGDVVVCVDNNEDGKEEATQIFILKSQTNENRGFCYTGYDFKRDKFFDAGNWCIERLATEEEKQKLFKAIKDNGFKWNPETKTLEKLIEPKFKVGDRVKKNKDYISGIVTDIFDDSFKVTYKGGSCSYVQFHYQHEWELVPNKFDISTLKPFDKVLVRDCNRDKWNIDFFSYYRDDGAYQCMTFAKNQCIPYEGNEHLLGTTNDCNEYFKTWE